MNKQELLTSMAQKSGLTKKDSEKSLTALEESIKDALLKGDKVQLIGFGTFEVKSRAERKGRNPKTNEEITIPAAKVPSFKAGSEFKKAL